MDSSRECFEEKRILQDVCSLFPFSLITPHRSLDDEGVVTLNLLHEKIIPTVFEVAALSPDNIPLSKQSKRLPRTDKADTPEFSAFARRVYALGYNDENFAGSELIEGGQEQPLDTKSVKNVARKLMGLLRVTHPNQKIRIKWVRASHLRSS
jgi:hypothetical protein